ncbi:MAG: class II fumarate hydratase [Balneolales bacterium]
MEFRTEKDSMGEIKVPEHAYYGAQTQRAIENFPISGIKFSRSFIQALGYVKQAAAKANKELSLLPDNIVQYISMAAREVIEGKLDEHFPVDIFQTGSGTSTNMNANEVIAARANELAKANGDKELKIHPNDHINFGQSSNDVIPTALRVSAVLGITFNLIPALKHLQQEFSKKGLEYKNVARTGRTHLMDAMPLTIKQQFGGYERQLLLGIERVESALEHLRELPQGGTAVGTGINTHPEFGKVFAKILSDLTSENFTEATDHFEAQATVDAPVEMSGQLKTLAVSFMKIANDLRWMNSGPNSGLSDVKLAALQPGSSIMPGKVNPVAEESAAMVCARVIGNDAGITIAGQAGNFELNVMLPLVAFNLNENIQILANTARNLADRSVSQLTVNVENIQDKLGKNPILVTALNPVIGYDLAAKIAKTAYAEGRSLKAVALEMSNLSEDELDAALDPLKMTKGGFTE